MKRGKGDLEGNQSSDFLSAMGLLELELHKTGGEVLIGGLEVVAVGRAFKLVQDRCLGMTLGLGYYSEQAQESQHHYFKVGDLIENFPVSL